MERENQIAVHRRVIAGSGAHAERGDRFVELARSGARWQVVRASA